MSELTIHNLETAPPDSKPLLENSQKNIGMIPNLHGVMASSAPLLEGYQTLHSLAQKTAFDAEELTVVWQTINVEHNCHYCVPAHTAIAHSMNVRDDLIEALRTESDLGSEKLNVLQQTTLILLRERGHIGESEKTRFYGQGYSHQHLLDIVLILAQKVMSNYVNHLADTPIDAPFKAFDWQKKS